MKNPWMLWFGTVFFALTLSLKTGISQTKTEKELSVAVRLTGCLVKGDEPKEVWLAEKNGRIYALESSTIELNAHLGQKVIVTGHVLSEGKEEAGGEQEQKKTGKPETADLRVITLQVISRACTQ